MNEEHADKTMRPNTVKRLWIKLIATLPLANTTILIENGMAVTKRGMVRSVLLSELAELAMSNDVQCACIMARTTSTGFSLSFYGIPKALHQRFRNVWGVHWR